MIVEDEWIIANDIKNSLVDFGYRIAAMAVTGEEAIDLVEKEQPDIILMDIILRGEMNGVQAAEKIREQHDIPIIYLTAYDNQFLVDKAKQTDHSGYLIKPYKDNELHIAIDMALHRFAQKQAERE